MSLTPEEQAAIERLRIDAYQHPYDRTCDLAIVATIALRDYPDDDSEPKSVSAFDRDTTHRLLVEAARHWCISHYLATGEVPNIAQFFAYPDGPHGFNWGNAPGPDHHATKPLRGKRYRITIELEST